MERESRKFSFEREHNGQPKPILGVPEMLKKLDNMYEREEQILKQIKSLEFEYKQLQDDKEMLQTMIMFQSNKESRKRQFGLK